ncbi:hypothetical protein [Parapedobacter tibetensis]|uniref:hypothetical protein n=1 Tax=Parapedobacter tibetensis TaxID=2972951 RepID=UPI00214D8618|nr:hypothetical protein [Parapedobacter tibetensis]
MDLQDFKRLNSLLNDYTWYGWTFLQTGMGLEWDAMPGRDYFATRWMEFFRGINDGTYHRLAGAITDTAYLPRFREEVRTRLAPLLAELEAATPERGMRKIRVRIDVDKFRRYETGLKQMSSDNIIFDMIQDDDDIRDTYFIDGDPDQIRSYLIQGIRGVLDQYNSAERERIRELENALKEMEIAMVERNMLLAVKQTQQQDLALKVNEQQAEIATLAERNRALEEILTKYQQEEEADGAGADQSGPIKDGKLRMYYLYKLGFLDNAIWNDQIKYGQRAIILRKILGGGPIEQGTALRYYKLFNSMGSTELRSYEADNEHKVLDYLKSICPGVKFTKGKFVNSIRKA